MTVLSLVPSASDATTTGTITAAQSGINTPVSNATVVLAVGVGQSSWKCTLTGANFTSGSTIVADHSSDGGTTWFTSNFKVAGGTTTVSSVVGPAPVEISGNDASISHIRVRCSVLGGGDSMSVAFRSGYGVGSVGLLSSLPAGTNVIGIVQPWTSSTATPITSVSAAVSDTSLLASNPSRKGAYFYNDSAAILYLSFGTNAASTTAYTVQIGANGFFELPTDPVYTNALRGIWSAANGAVRITELS